MAENEWKVAGWSTQDETMASDVTRRRKLKTEIDRGAEKQSSKSSLIYERREGNNAESMKG